MRVLLHVDFWAQPDDGSQGFARLRIDDLPFAPFIGFEFEHPAWHDAKKVVAVSWNIEDESLNVVLDRDNVGSPEHTAAHKEGYVHHGWTVDANPPNA